MRPMMRSLVCNGAAIMVCTFCSTMLMRPLKASSSWASRTRIEARSSSPIAHAVLMRKPFALVRAGNEFARPPES